MTHRWTLIGPAVLLALTLIGCRGVTGQELFPVGTCVREDAAGSAAVACSDPHTHKVIAIAERAEECPIETTMYSQPADPDDGTTTVCFQSHTATE